MNARIEARLKALIGDYCPLDVATLSRETLTDDIGLDSLSLTQIIAALEKEFSFGLSDEDLTNLLVARSIGDFSDVLSHALNRPKHALSAESVYRG